MSRAVFAGSFDPFTRGHMNIVDKSLKIFDEVIVAVLINPSKHFLFSRDERVDMISMIYKDCPKLQVKTFDGLLVDFARQEGVNTLIRGIKDVSTFAGELRMNRINKSLSPDVETVYIATDLQYSFISSSAVKEIASFNGDLSQYLDPRIEKLFIEKTLSKEGEEK